MRLEKVLSVFLAIVIMVITVPVTAIAAETEGYYTYTVSSGKATITDVDISISGAVVIPDKLGGYPVTRITETAFLGCSGITKITIPGSVTVIDSFAFETCYDITEVHISNIANWCKIKSAIDPLVYNNAGLYLNGILLTDVIIPKVITQIGSGAFQGYKKLKYVTLSNAVTTIDKMAFANCTNLVRITIPSSVTSIGNDAFAGCGNLWIHCEEGSYAHKYAMQNSIAYIISKPTIPAFEINNGILTKYNGNATNVIIPDGVVGIGASAFAFASGIKSVTIPEGVTFIGTGAFSFCPGLETVVLPSTLETIDTGAFAFCPALSDITIPESVTLIGDGAFDCCYALGEVYIRDTVETIGEDAFKGCETLTLRCYSTSSAATYAQENDVNYRLIISGDADDNGSVNANDVVYLSKIANGAALEAGYGADADRDGVVNANDLVLLSKMANGAAIA